MKIRFILNPSAGRAIGLERLTAAVRKVLSSDRGIFEVRVSKDDNHGRTLAEEAVREGYNYVFACGGDGTVHHVGSALVGTTTILGIVPSGSGNALAGALNIPEDVERAVAVIKAGRVVGIDVGTVDRRLFFTSASLGIEAEVCRAYNTMWLNPRGILPYIPVTLWQYLRYSPPSLAVSVDGESFRTTPLIFTVTNIGVFGGGFVISPYSEPYDGVFELCVVDGVSFMKGMGAGLRLIRGSLHRADYYRVFETDHVVVTSDTPRTMQLDGETFKVPERLEFKLLKGAVRVWAY